MLHTPYLDAHKEYQGSLTRIGMDLSGFSNREQIEFVLTDNGRVIWRSHVINPLWAVDSKHPISYYYSERSRLRLYFYYKKYLRGYAYQVIKRVPSGPAIPKKYINGLVRTTFQAMIPGYPLIVRNARKSVLRVASPPKAATSTSLPRSTSLRPNPETITGSYNRVFEGITFGSYSITVTPQSRSAYQRTWTGVRTPGFGKLKKRQLPVNPHTVSLKHVDTDSLIQWQRNNFRPAGDFNLEINAYSVKYAEPGVPVHSALARNNAIRKLIDRAQLGIDANLAQDFAQIGQTTRLIGDVTRKIAKSYLQLKRGDILGAANTLTAGRNGPKMPSRGRFSRRTGDLADNWLALQYGWKPLLQDINGTLNSLASLQGSTQFVQRATASARVRTSSSSSFPSTLWAAKFGTTNVVSETRCSFVLRYKIDDHLKSFLAQTGFCNPVNLTWEILPFSFVVDWFLPIGPFLETLSSWTGLQFVDGSQTLFTKQEVVSSADWSGRQLGGGTDNSYEEHSAYRRTWIILDRSLLTSFPSMTFPEFKNGLASVTHAANGLALLKSVFGR